MRSIRLFVILLAAVASGLVSSAALARGGHHHHRHHHHWHSGLSLGFVLGAPLWYPAPAYSYPYPYAYPPVVVNPAPRVYVEREDQALARESAPGYWYYCRETNLYYPYAKECAGPWERVPAQPQQ